MWIFTQHGFVSAVTHFDNNDKIIVRARDKQSLEMPSLLFSKTIVTTPKNDYPFRVVLERSEFIEFMRIECEMIDYTNFKGRLDSSRGEQWHDTAFKVWSVMHEIEDQDAREPQVMSGTRNAHLDIVQ